MSKEAIKIDNTNKAALIILDGWGHGKNPKVSAIAQANTPFVDSLYENYPNAELVTFGEEVGLPEGQMGNSEVGHLNIGAGRVVYQDLAKINKEIRDNTLSTNEAFRAGIKNARNTNRRFHIMGLLSSGGVHAHIDHLYALLDVLAKEDVEVYIHAFLDGRDTDPNGGEAYLSALQEKTKGTNAKIATVVGRYYAMDRDNRWERIKKAYDLLVSGQGEVVADVSQAVKAKYEEGITDEFMSPLRVEGDDNYLKPEDTVLFYNYRTDRPREITQVLTQKDMPDQGMKTLPLYYMTMTNYDKSFTGVHVLYDKDNLKETIGEVISKAGLSQVRIAETEKYPHVTFFFSGGREKPFEKESRILVPSPKVDTYDEKPEMSALEVTDLLIDHIHNEDPDFVCLNYANTDMVGHTGIFEAAVKAAETVDSCLQRLVNVLNLNDYAIFIIADHGNSDIMVNEDGSPHTAHTTNMVPIIYLPIDKGGHAIKDGKLGDLAPTILKVMNVNIPEEMTGKPLV